MVATAQTPSPLRPLAVIGYSVNDEILCSTCLITTTPITGERVSHICRKNTRPIPDALRRQILQLDHQKMGAQRIATRLKTTLPTVMKVISGDDDDAASCPACEASRRTDTREIIPLYFGDPTVREETCTHCLHSLVEIAVRATSDRQPSLAVDHVTYGDAYPALAFARRPPEAILQALKAAGWKWRPSSRVWVDFSRTAELPEAIRPPPTPAAVTAKPPIIRRHKAQTAEEATVH